MIALAFLAANSSDSRGESKQPSPKATQQNATQQERGTENSPVVVKVLPTEKPQKEIERETEKEKSDRLLVSLTGDLAKYTNRLFWATCLLALITAGLVIAGFFQVCDSKRSIAAAEASVKIAERALTELEAPFLVIKIHDSGIQWKPARNITFDDVKFTVTNYGRTPAHVLELLESVIQVPKGETVPILDPGKQRGNPMPYGVISPPQSETQIFKTVSNINFFEGGGCGAFPDVMQRAWFRGFVRYRDIFGSQFVMGFCFVFDTTENRWVLMGGKGHNYCKRDDATEFPEWMHPSADKGSVRSAINRAVLQTKGGTQAAEDGGT
jgi:hypothetical protein